ncbi:MAG TPA: vWA domain-containing protein [Roseiflexaceae bacterium]|nr:vWA domain-containing protein [Roseiflexaceae bacterium]
MRRFLSRAAKRCAGPATALLVLSALLLGSTPGTALALTATPTRTVGPTGTATPTGTPTITPTATFTPTPATAAAIVFDDRDRSLCRYDAISIGIQGTVSLPPGQEALLVTSWYVANPADQRTDPERQEFGLVRGGDRFSVTARWPGIRAGDTIVQLYAGAILLDPQTRNPLMPRGASRSFYWYPWVCPAPTAQPSATTTSTATSTPTVTPTPRPTVRPTATPTVIDPLGSVSGPISIQPKSEIRTVTNTPQLYAIVMDFSNSMSANFLGQVVINGVVRQCFPGPDPALNARLEADAPICRATAYPAWPQPEERRLAVEKQAVKALIQTLDPQDQVTLVRMSSGSLITPSPLTLADAAGKATLLQQVDAMSAHPSDPLLGVGGTPAASALFAVRRLLESPSTPTTAPNGRPYGRQIILLIDSVANHYRNINNGRYTISGGVVGWYNTAQDQQPLCTNPNDRVECQIGFADTTIGQVARPLTALAIEGMELQVASNVAVIGLAGVPSAGLTETASQPFEPWFQQVDNAAVLTKALLSTKPDIVEECFSETGPWTDRIDPANVPDPAVLPGVSESEVGEVTLTASDGAQVVVPIWRNRITSELFYQANGLRPGDYTLSAWIGYKGRDGVTRRYDIIEGWSGGAPGPSLPVTVAPGDTPTAQILGMMLGEQLCP